MREVTKEQVAEILARLGIHSGDSLLVHSAVQFLGLPVGGLQIYLDALLETIGLQGTLVVPTFNFDFTQGVPYDPAQTPSRDMGALSEFVRLQPQARRSLHPMQSIAAIGCYAEDLTARDTPSAFGSGSAFERMLELDFKLLLLGANERAVSVFHYCEQRCQVPYRYWKEFRGQVRTAAGWQTRAYQLYVRHQIVQGERRLQPELTLDPVVEWMQAHRQWHSLPLNYGSLTTCQLRDFVAAVERFLTEDPWSLVTNVRVLPDGSFEILPHQPEV